MNALGNMLWYTDASFHPVPGALSMLYAHAVPTPGPKGDGRRYDETQARDLRRITTQDGAAPLDRVA